MTSLNSAQTINMGQRCPWAIVKHITWCAAVRLACVSAGELALWHLQVTAHVQGRTHALAMRDVLHVAHLHQLGQLLHQIRLPPHSHVIKLCKNFLLLHMHSTLQSSAMQAATMAKGEKRVQPGLNVYACSLEFFTTYLYKT